MKTYPIEINVNGKWLKAEVTARHTLLETLRDQLGAYDVKNGCAQGDCGACTVIMAGKAVNACLTLALQADGKDILTLKGIGTAEQPHALQESFVQHGAIQCGFCTPGMIVTAKALLDNIPNPDDLQIREAISGNLCRCTGYKKIIEAIEDVASKSQGKPQGDEHA
jgi:carbon-monoxide dehydrogenase small subunit